jgi:putative sporulation protein YyaC
MPLTVVKREDKTTYYISSEDKEAVELLTECLYNMIVNHPKKYDRIAVVCIGTDRSTGDSLGPLVGKFLRRRRKIKKVCRVWGCLDYPVHAKNLNWYLDRLIDKDKHLVIAIDACVGIEENIGKVLIQAGCMKPGSGVKKDLPEIGDISICGVVNFEGFMTHLVLQNTRLSLVYKMAEIISEAVNKALSQLVDIRRSSHSSLDLQAD